MKKHYALLIITLLSVTGLFAQSLVVKGKITDTKGETLPGVIVKSKETGVGAVTDLDGNYTLTLDQSKDKTLVFKLLGFEDKEAPVGAEVNIKLAKTNVDLNPVIISASKREEKALDAPASIGTVSTQQVQARISPVLTEHLQNIQGVDIMRTGISSNNTVIRGFNNIFSGAALNLVDNRIASVPSLRVNVQQLIPINYDDVERIEVLKGPTSALYGPNAANGAIHFITKSPLDMKKRFESSVSYTYGSRDVNILTMRHAGKIVDKEDGIKIGYKVSAQYMQGHDWTYNDPVEPDSIQKGKQTADGRIPVGDSIANTRNNFIHNLAFDARLDIRFNNNTSLVLSGGRSTASGVELTGLGAAQIIDWTSAYFQARFRHKNLFVQSYMNTNNAGTTYLLRSGDLIVDKSKFIVSQVQYTHQVIDNLKFIYGADGLFTIPNTDGSINGTNEDSDNIYEYGAYAQGQWDVNEKFKIIGAARLDYHNFVKKLFASPRLAFVYKPKENQTIRLTYNRAFSSPVSNNVNLDILQIGDAFGFNPQIGPLFGNYDLATDVRVYGNRNGYNYNFVNGLPQFRSAFSGAPGVNTGDKQTFYNYNDTTFNSTAWTVGYLGLAQSDALPNNVKAILNGVVPLGALNGAGNAVSHMIKNVNLTTGAFDGPTLDPTKIKDLGRLTNSPTQTVEIGWNGIIKQRLLASIDVYGQKITDFVSPLTVITPNVFLDPNSVAAFLQPIIANNLAGLSGSDINTLNTQFGATGNTDLANKIAAFYGNVAAQVPFGTVSPNQARGNEIILTYGNFGTVNMWGADLGLTYFLSENARVGVTYSFVNRNQFESEGYQIALNAPRHKFNINASYKFEKAGIEIGARGRWQDAFPVNSGVYVGNVGAFWTLDANAQYSFSFVKNLKLGITGTNLLNYKRAEFVGTPQLGRMLMYRLSYTF
jgi:outer membrane receptor for ferrienterochelin and colicins